MRLSGTRVTAIAQGRGFGNQLWDLAGVPPSLDLQFAESKSLVDATTGQNLVTFTRASSGTYVGSDGLIQTAVTNLLLRSEEFDNASWTKTNSSITDNAIAAPNGTLTADKLNANTTNGIHAARRDETVLANTAYTLTFFAKAAEYTFLAINHGHTLVADHHTFFNLSNGTIGTNAAGNTATIQPAGDGWYRCSVTRTTGASQTSLSSRALACQSDNVTAFAGDTNSGIYIWGAQLEQSSTVGEYIPTTSTINSAPRFDHNPTTGESLGLLVEEQRTNLLLHSACDSNWPTGGFGTATYNLGLSALGVFSGVQVASSGQNWHSIYRTGINLTASTVYAFTLFYRAGTSGRVRLTFRNNSTATETVANGLAGNLSVSAQFAGSAAILSQYLCSDGLTYVVTGTYTPNGTGVDHWFRIGPDSTVSGQTVIALGGQLEAGAFPTSYIPTTTATVTRSADVASISGSNFSSWYRADEGTLLGQIRSLAAPLTAPGRPILHLTDNVNSFIDIRVRPTQKAGFVSNVAGSVQADLASVGNYSTLETKVAGAYKIDDFALVLNAETAAIDTSGNVPSGINLARIGTDGSNSYTGTIRRLTYWPTRLPNSTLQAVTQ